MLILSKSSKRAMPVKDVSKSDSSSNPGGLIFKKCSNPRKSDGKTKTTARVSTPTSPSEKLVEAEYTKIEALIPVYPDPSMATAVALLNMNNTLLYTMLK